MCLQKRGPQIVRRAEGLKLYNLYANILFALMANTNLLLSLQTY
jgi:hypothetical protein